jgi:hypothetical protein
MHTHTVEGTPLNVLKGVPLGRASDGRIMGKEDDDMMTMKNDDDHHEPDFIFDIMNLELEITEGCIHHHDHH